jgi:uncharacterized protein
MKTERAKLSPSVDGSFVQDPVTETIQVVVQDETLVLHHKGAMYWPSRQQLFVSDLHLGKAAHFRKAGIPLREGHDARTMARLEVLMEFFRPAEVVFLGDLFHSDHNLAWDVFAQWCGKQTARLHLLLGNHDVLAPLAYRSAGLVLHRGMLADGPFVFMHEVPPHHGSEGGYAVGGHVHPGIRLALRGGQGARLPCFLLGLHRMLLPAFGENTGCHYLKPQSQERVFACLREGLMDVSDVARPLRSPRK